MLAKITKGVKKLKRKFLIVLLSLVCALCLAFGLSACDLFSNSGDNEDKNSNTETENLPELDYTLSDDGTHYIITGIGTCTDTDITIPSTYNNLLVTSIGDNAFEDCTSLTSVTIGSGVTSIGNYAFSYCTSLESVTIPNSVTTIGESTFYFCTALAKITIGNGIVYIGDEAFYRCGSLTSVYYNGTASQWASISFSFTTSNPLFYAGNLYLNGTLATNITLEGITTINDYTFCGCTSIKSVTILDSITSIGVSAFADCESLTSVTIGKSVTSIKNEAFSLCTALTEINFNATAMEDLSPSFYSNSNNNAFCDAGKNGDGVTVTIGANVTKIPAYLFYPHYSGNYAPKITNIAFEEGSVCENIGDCTFYCCTSLESITIPDSVTSIGEYALSNCTSLTNINIPDSVTTIGQFAFSGCTSLINVIIGDGVTSLNSYTFYLCTSLANVTIGKSVTSIGDYAFNHCTALTKINFNATAMDDLSKNNDVFSNAGQSGDGINVTIGANVTKIPAYLFCPYSFSSSYAPKIISVEFEDNSVCTSIGTYAFYWCTSLESVIIGDNVTSVGIYAFWNCTSLTRVTIGIGVESIHNYAFCGCTALTEINFNATAMKDLSSDNTVFYKAGQSGTGITVNIGANVTVIPAWLFCPNSSTTNYSPKITSVVFEDISVCASIGRCSFFGCTSLTSVTLPDSLVSIGAFAFQDCSSLTNLTFGNGVTSIDTQAFAYCTSLTSLTLSDSVTSIGQSAFNSCTSLKNVTIGSGVTSIGFYAFCNCTALISVTFKDTTTWYRSQSSGATSGGTNISSSSLLNTSTAATYLTSTYYNYYWYRK